MSLLGLLTALTVAIAPVAPASATVSSGGSIYVGVCPLASFTLTGTSGPINRVPGPTTMTLAITSSCVVDTATGVPASLQATISSSSFGCFGGLATGSGNFVEDQRTRVVGVTLLNAGGTWSVFMNGLLTFSGAATGVSFPIACSLGTPAPSLTALGSLAFEDPELPA